MSFTPALLAILALVTVARAENCPNFDAPEARLTWVAKNMLVNGIPMSVMQIDSDQPQSVLLAHYRVLWSKSGQVREYPVGDWQAIATARERCFYTFQVKKTDRGSTGFLSVSTAPDKTPAPAGAGFPMPAGSKTLNDIEHRDDRKQGRTVFLSNEQTMQSNAIFYRSNLPAHGWKIVSERQFNSRRGPGIVLDLRRELNQAMLTISRSDGRTYVLFNYMDRP